MTTILTPGLAPRSCKLKLEDFAGGAICPAFRDGDGCVLGVVLVLREVLGGWRMWRAVGGRKRSRGRGRDRRAVRWKDMFGVGSEEKGVSVGYREWGKDFGRSRTHGPGGEVGFAIGPVSAAVSEKADRSCLGAV